METADAAPLVLIEDLHKSFPGVHALRGAKFDLRRGEVHALMGENGAGKSTLMKVLAGIYVRDSGTILLDGKPVDIRGPHEARDNGIGIIHQELNLMNHLTVAQNIFIGRETKNRTGLFLDEKAMNAATAEMLASLKVEVDPKTKVGELTVAKQQMVEIVKALSYDSRVLIMDEPTAALNDAEIEELFRIIRDLKAKGVGIVYISHKMDELKRISDRVTVMRDGEYIGTLATAEATLDQVISMMVGRPLQSYVRADAGAEIRPVALEVKSLNQGRTLKNIGFQVRKGEILGFAGLMGAGRTETARAVFGADPIDSGEVFVHGRKVHIRTPQDAVKAGIGYLSEDRKRFGLALGMDVQANTVMAALGRFLNFGAFLKNKAMEAAGAQYIASLSIKTPSQAQKLKFLSGGNQQKVVIAKWLLRDCDVLFFDEPTRGIDVGAKFEIYKLLQELADAGKAIVMISSELPEVLRLSHRIVVMCEGRITGELTAAEATQERIMQLATLRSAEGLKK
jgi:ribose transport system ATP-binding protein